MDVHFENPNLEARIENWVAETGRTREDAFAGYFEELSRDREMLDSRYNDLKNGRIRPMDGDRFFAELRRREDELPGQKTQIDFSLTTLSVYNVAGTSGCHHRREG